MSNIFKYYRNIIYCCHSTGGEESLKGKYSKEKL